MHVAIKGFDIKPAEQPKANLVFLLDVSGSMDEPDKLPLLQSAFRLLVTSSARRHGVDRHLCRRCRHGADADQGVGAAKILSAIDNLTPGGTTAGEAGIREAYRLAEQSFVKDGVNRVMLATDGDFNVGQTDDDDLKRLIEEKRKSRRLPVGVRLRPRQPQRPDDADDRPERQRHGRLYRHAGRGREGAGRGCRPRRCSRSPRT